MAVVVALAAGLGETVGLAVGETVGLAVGETVGVAVGVGVGVGVGTGVGNGVGTGRGVATTIPVNVVLPVTTISSHCVTSAVVTLFAPSEVRWYALKTVGGFPVASWYTLALSFAVGATT